MNSESQPQSIPDFQELKEQYKNRLEQILYKEPTVENMETFADDALEDLITLNEDILLQYRTNPSFEPNKPDPLFKDGEQEDDAYKKLGLPNIQEILKGVGEVKTRIDNIKDYIAHNKQYSGEVMTPPTEHTHEIRGGSGEGIKEAKLIPRLVTLMYLLETDLSVRKEDVRITEGEVTKEMMRKEPYVRVEIPDLDRAVYICDEEGNASYVLDTKKLQQLGLTLDEVDIDDKRDKNSLIAMHPGTGVRIIQSKYWRRNVSLALSENIPEKPPINQDTIEEFGRQGTEESRASEFVEKKEWLPFDKFQEEVRALYPGDGNTQLWYRKEKIKHKDWHSAPHKFYEGKGWVGWSELVGIENRLKKEWLPFDKFQEEVVALYPGDGDVQVWYDKERAKHKNWHSAPEKFYKDEGWAGWPELVGRENLQKKECPSFEGFQAEVRVLYPGEGNVQVWYREEKDKHKNWPSAPDKYYKDEGWVGWSELVSRENRLKKEWLPFEDFQAEVRALYTEEKDVHAWYQKERVNHENWPASPDKLYKDKGWIGLPELVGRENLQKKEWLPFDKFQEEVRALYPGEGGAQLWYHKERVKHKNWHSAPHKFYKNNGWSNWSNLVGK